jgi:sulfate transport system permease protein
VARYGLRTVALVYLLFLLVLPVGLICWTTFQDGIAPVIESLTTPSALHAFAVTAQVAVLTVIANTVFGVGTAVLLVRHEFRGRRVLNMLVDLPLAVSPVVVGLALVLVYGRFAPFGGWLADLGIDVIFSLPGMVLATIFVCLPLVVRAVTPVLEEIGIEQEQAAESLGANGLQRFWRITLPSIKWGITYGVVLTLARSLGEFGAVKVVSGNVLGQTRTATLAVEEKYLNFDQQGAYATAFLLAMVSVACIVIVGIIRPKNHG